MAIRTESGRDNRKASIARAAKRQLWRAVIANALKRQRIEKEEMYSI